MADQYTSGEDAEKVSPPSESDASSSSSQAVSVPIATTELDLEKTASKASQRTQRSGRADPRTPTVVQDWDGVDDPDNPLNWPTAKKIYHTLIPALQCFTMYASHPSPALCSDRHANTAQHIRILSLHAQ